MRLTINGNLYHIAVINNLVVTILLFRFTRIGCEEHNTRNKSTNKLFHISLYFKKCAKQNINIPYLKKSHYHPRQDRWHDR